MRLFSRTVPLAPWAAVLACPVGMGARAGVPVALRAVPGAGGGARRKVGVGLLLSGGVVILLYLL